MKLMPKAKIPTKNIKTLILINLKTKNNRKSKNWNLQPKFQTKKSKHKAKNW